MKNILVPTDFSENADNALQFALEIAKRSGAIIMLHHSCDDTLPTVEGFQNAVIESRAKEKLLQMIAHVHSVPTMKNVQMRLNTAFGSLVSNVADLVERTQADLIVMGTQGASGLQKVIVGTSTVAVIKDVNCPTLVIPERASPAPFDTMAMASDTHSMESDEVLKPLKELISLFSSTVNVVHVEQKAKMVAYNDTLEPKSDRFVLGEGIAHNFTEVCADTTIEGLDYYAKEGGRIDMMAMLKRKHNLLDRFFNVSNTETMAFHTEIPLLVMHE